LRQDVNELHCNRIAESVQKFTAAKPAKVGSSLPLARYVRWAFFSTSSRVQRASTPKNTGETSVRAKRRDQ